MPGRPALDGATKVKTQPRGGCRSLAGRRPGGRARQQHRLPGGGRDDDHRSWRHSASGRTTAAELRHGAVHVARRRAAALGDRARIPRAAVYVPDRVRRRPEPVRPGCRTAGRAFRDPHRCRGLAVSARARAIRIAARGTANGTCRGARVCMNWRSRQRSLRCDQLPAASSPGEPPRARPSLTCMSTGGTARSLSDRRSPAATGQTGQAGS